MWIIVVFRLHLLFWIMLTLRCSPLRQRRDQIALTASSPFRMILSRTDIELEARAIRLLEDVAASHLLDYSSSSTQQQPQAEAVKDVEIVIQSAELQPALSSTNVRFFALATFTAIDDATTSETSTLDVTERRQEDLDTLIYQSFSAPTWNELFVQRLLDIVIESNDAVLAAQLQGADSVVVATVAPAPSPVPPGMEGNGSQKERLSRIDTILIVVSSGILIGIVWMILLYYKDLGYFTTLPNHQVLSNATGSFPNDAASFPQVPYSDDVHQKVVPSGGDDPVEDRTNTLSTTNTDKNETEDDTNTLPLINNVEPPQPLLVPSLDKVDNLVAKSTSSSTNETLAPEYSYPAMDSAEWNSLELSQTLDATNASSELHHDAKTVPLSNDVPVQSQSPDHVVTVKNGSDSSSREDALLTEPFQTNVFRMDGPRRKESSTGSASVPPIKGAASDDSEDVFQVDVAESVAGDSASKQSSTQEIMDWMKSVHVVTVSGDRSASVMTNSTDGQRSTKSAGDRSTSAESGVMSSSCLEVASLGHASLEQSMASSTPSTGEVSSDTAIL